MFAPYKISKDKRCSTKSNSTPLANSPTEVDYDFSNIENLISLTNVNSNDTPYSDLHTTNIKHDLHKNCKKNKHKLNLVQKFDQEDIENKNTIDDYNYNDAYLNDQVEPVRTKLRDRRSISPVKSSFDCMTKSEIFIIAGVSWLLLIMILLVLVIKS